MGASLGIAAGVAGVQLLGGLIGADAQGRAAGAQLTQQREDRAQASGFAEPSPEELKNMQNMINFSEQDIQRKTKLLESSDPALIEAGKQALQLLQGTEAKTLAPLKTAQAKQEAMLRERLQSQLGPGSENTTAGIQALQAFNEQSASALAGAQERSLGQLLGVAQDSSARYGNLNMQQQLAQTLGGVKNRQINAILGTNVDPGLQFAGQAAYGSALSGAAGNFGQTMLLGSMLGGGASPTAGTMTSQVMPTSGQ
jgi:hypothetical protein